MKRGRPIGSDIRMNIAEILYFLPKSYGYQITKVYNVAFPPCTREVIYYHLRKGTALGEFVMEQIVSEKGEFSWGTEAVKVYYSLGANSHPSGKAQVKTAVAEVLAIQERLKAAKPVVEKES